MPSDASKKVILRKAIHPDLNMMATASSLKANCTYDVLCSDLLGEHHQQLASKKTSAAALTESTKIAVAAVSEEPAANYANLHGGRAAFNNRKRFQRPDHRQDNRQSQAQPSKKPFTGTCFNCKKEGHRIADCFAPGGPKAKTQGKKHSAETSNDSRHKKKKK